MKSTNPYKCTCANTRYNTGCKYHIELARRKEESERKALASKEIIVGDNPCVFV